MHVIASWQQNRFTPPERKTLSLVELGFDILFFIDVLISYFDIAMNIGAIFESCTIMMLTGCLVHIFH